MQTTTSGAARPAAKAGPTGASPAASPGNIAPRPSRPVEHPELYDLEAKLLYSMIVAGKSATFANAKTRDFLKATGSGSPFALIRELGKRGGLLGRLMLCRTGNYSKLNVGFRELGEARLDLRTCTVHDLERIHGIGPKTSRFFLLWTRGDKALCAALDTHVLKWLRHVGYEAPLATPSGLKYAALEAIFLGEAAARGMSARELDAAIWDFCSAGRHKTEPWPDALARRALAP